MSKARTIGTTPLQIQAAEQALGRTLPLSFSRWLLEHNGRSLGALTIFPVFDPRDPRKTWDSIVRNDQEAWAEWKRIFRDSRVDLSSLLPFAMFGTGDFYCFDYAASGATNEPMVVLWSHETGTWETVADNFDGFLESTDRPG